MPELLQDWVTTRAEQRPEAVAVVGGRHTLTYGELEALSNRLAWSLKRAGCTKGDRVCLLTPKSPAAIAGILGIYKADCVYVPLDPSNPAARLGKILEACETRWVLAAGPVTRLVTEISEDSRFATSIAVGWMDRRRSEAPTVNTAFALEDVERQPGERPKDQNAGPDPAHILFTSGSTGTPKGVVISHANVIAFVEWATRYFGMQSSDRVSAHSPLHFDLSMFDIFGTFAAGAQLHLVPPELSVLPNKLAEFIRSAELTQWFSVPSVLNYMARFDVVKFDDFPALRRLLWCGEVLPTPALIYWMRRLPHVRFTNLYGPTETTIASSYYSIPECPRDEMATIPIGTACDGEELLVLDEALREVRDGGVGGLYIRGVGLSPGYWRDPGRTREVFLPNPRGSDPSDRIYKTGDLARVGADGLVYFLGRADSQIKSRGYRIELGEVEAALNAVPGLQECAVVAVDSEGFEGKAICCAYVPSRGVDVTNAGLRRELSGVLPGYMLPSRWLALDRLPKNTNGKIDRRALKEAFETHAVEANRQHKEL